MNYYFDPDDQFMLDMKEWFENNKNIQEDLQFIGSITPWNKNKKGLQVAWNKGIKLSDEMKKKISVATSKAMKGVLKSEEHKKNAGAASGKSRVGIKLKASQHRKDKISESNSKEWIVDIDGIQTKIKNLKKYCNENNLSYAKIRKVATNVR